MKKVKEITSTDTGTLKKQQLDLWYTINLYDLEYKETFLIKVYKMQKIYYKVIWSLYKNNRNNTNKANKIIQYSIMGNKHGKVVARDDMVKKANDLKLILKEEEDVSKEVIRFWIKRLLSFL